MCVAHIRKSDNNTNRRKWAVALTAKGGKNPKEIEQSYKRKSKGLKINLFYCEVTVTGKELYDFPYGFASFCPQGNSVPYSCEVK